MEGFRSWKVPTTIRGSLATSDGSGKPLESLITFVVLEGHSSCLLENRLEKGKDKCREMSANKC